MPVLTLQCPQCRHEYRSLVLEGTLTPRVWVCSKCGSEGVAPKADEPVQDHPWEKRHAYGCLCCGA
jgi:DNA-directed RNA polymerase subunit RPC12/RpoP